MKLHKNTERMLWTDSKCVLHWIKNKDGKSVFVKNRVEEILAESNISFRYINTKDNPADLPTRGISFDDLKDNQLWWHGPRWLSQDKTCWPTWDTPILYKTDDPEHTKQEIIYEISGIAQECKQKDMPPFGIDETRYSSLPKLLKVTAYVKRLIQLLKKQAHKTDCLTAREINEAERMWITYVQRKNFISDDGEITQQLGKSQLNPKKHADEIIRVHGRYANADLSAETKLPILIPRKENFTNLLIKHIHHKIFYFGTSHTLADIRKTYWIPQGRATVKAVLKKCFLCRRFQGGPYKIKPMSPWPTCKVSKSAAFKFTGLDYFGPLFIKKATECSKVWVYLFTCIATRGIHLELVEDMTPEKFLMALRRFIARRGRPEVIISDNAPQFKVADTTLEKAWQKILRDAEVQSNVSEQGITWLFIKELSPWMGGFYERLIGITKTALKKSVGRLSLTNIQLQTTLSEIEAIVNSRPLIYLEDDVNSPIITPQHFLSINTKNGSPTIGDMDERNDPDYLHQKMDSSTELLETWKKGNRYLDQFWDVWKSHYLTSLRERSQIFNKHASIQSAQEPNIGDVVQIKDTTSRGTWKIGRIIELVSSEDGLIRAAKIILPNKTVL